MRFDLKWALVGAPNNFNRIVSSLGSIVSDLEAHSKALRAKAVKKTEEAAKLLAEREEHVEEALKADNARAKIADLIG